MSKIPKISVYGSKWQFYYKNLKLVFYMKTPEKGRLSAWRYTQPIIIRNINDFNWQAVLSRILIQINKLNKEEK